MSSGLDLSQVVPAINAPNELLATLAYAVQAEWGAQARQHLNASAQRVSEYVNGLSTRVDGDTATVELRGLMPNILEQGMGPGGVGTSGAYDVRRFLLQPTTRNIRRGKKGLYLNVPFDQSMGTIQALGGAQAVRAARALRAAVTFHTSAGMVRGFEPTRNPNQRRALAAGYAPNLRPQDVPLPGGLVQRAHATDPLAGMQRMLQVYQGTTPTQSTYRTWRTASEGGKPWISRGVQARNIRDRVLAAIPQILGRIL